jgi:hypothetical protein
MSIRKLTLKVSILLSALVIASVKSTAENNNQTEQKGAFIEYHDVNSALLDGADAIGHSIVFDAKYRTLAKSNAITCMVVDAVVPSRRPTEAEWNKFPSLIVSPEEDTKPGTWYIRFDKSFNSPIIGLRHGQRLSIKCFIVEMSGPAPECDLETISVK